MSICFLGLPKSGKTSIIKTIFERAGPAKTMMLDLTTKIEKTTKTISSFPIDLYDFPGKYKLKEARDEESKIVESCRHVIFVIDVQEDNLSGQIKYILDCIKFFSRLNCTMTYNIFLHKIDTDIFSSEEKQLEFMEIVKTFLKQELEDASIDGVAPRYFLTSIYDHSLLEGFSKVLQKAIPNLDIIASLVDTLTESCKMKRAFLFEMRTKTYIASDTAPVESQEFALCTDMIDVVINLSTTLGVKADKDESIITLQDSTLLYFKEIDNLLAVVCFFKEQDFESPLIISHNIEIFNKGLNEILKLEPSK